MSQNLAKGCNISMYDRDWAIVDSADQFDAGRSATLRKIVRQWAEWRKQFQPAHALTDERAPYHVEHFDGIHEEPT